MMEENENQEKHDLKNETSKQKTVTIRKSYIVAIIGAIVMISVFALAFQGMITNTSAAQGAYINGQIVNAPSGPTVPIQDGKQIVKITMQGSNYAPNPIRLRKGVPTVFDVDTNSVRGCYRSIQIPVFGIRKLITASDNKIEFTPDKAGTFGFSCSMGMGTGQIIVEDESGTVPDVNTVAQDIPKGGSCGSGGGCGCGG